MNINGLTSFPVADVLAAKGTPFLFSTGHGSSGILAAYAHVPMLHKPFQESHLAKALGAILA